jgi:hypothetical protein
MSSYTEAVELWCEGLENVSPGPCPGCSECDLEDVDSMDAEEYELASEGWFSWSRCDSCGTTLGGDRFNAHAFPVEGEGYIHLEICSDCLFYFAYGDEPEIWER